MSPSSETRNPDLTEALVKIADEIFDRSENEEWDDITVDLYPRNAQKFIDLGLFLAGWGREQQIKAEEPHA